MYLDKRYIGVSYQAVTLLFLKSVYSQFMSFSTKARLVFGNWRLCRKCHLVRRQSQTDVQEIASFEQYDIQCFTPLQFYVAFFTLLLIKIWYASALLVILTLFLKYF